MWWHFWLRRKSGYALMAILTFNILFYSLSFFQRNGLSFPSCEPKDYLRATTKFIEANGEKPLKELLNIHCKSVSSSSEVVEQLKSAVHHILEHCQNQVQEERSYLQIPILTLFTSWEPNETKHLVHNNTIRNWLSLRPHIIPVMFTNNLKYRELCNSAGWHVYPLLHYAAGRAPILKKMFLQIMQNFNTSFYAYANGDILFERGLIDTMIMLLNKMQVNSSSHPLLVIGRRTNVEFLTEKEASSYKNLHQTAMQRGKLFLANAEDYFITNQNYPWAEIPDLVIGRLAYDNWLVMHARRLNHTVIDATETILAIHQTTKAGNWEGHKRKFTNYNDVLLKHLKLPHNYRNGETWCAGLRTFYNLCGRTSIQSRNILKPQCKL